MIKTSENSRIVYRHELVEVLIPAGSTSTRFNIPDLPNLRDVHLLGLSLYTSPDITLGIQNQVPVMTLVKATQTAFITLVNYNGKEFLKQAPAVNFKTIYNEDMQVPPPGSVTLNVFDTDIKQFSGQKVNYPKSYIEFSVAPAEVGNDTVFMFGVWYAMPTQTNQGSFMNRK